MKRVAFLMQANQSDWLGGLSYLRNLIQAICANSDREIEPVLFVHPAMEQGNLVGFPTVEVVRTTLVAPRHPVRLASRAAFSLIDRDLTLELLLRKHRIDVLSHSPMTGARSGVASIGWIPDFQHVRMPQYFTELECQNRDRQFMRLVKGCQRIILSSNDARRDFTSFAPHAIQKASVLHFVSCLNNPASALLLDQLRQRFGIDRPYFHLPNQFWAHKNHSLVIDAIGILKRRGVNILVLATGKAADHRDPHHFDRLMARVKQEGLEANFRVLGVVTLPELQSLMLHALALINPSNFEGWSTTVEEAKSLGLPIILSDIPVHLEQAPPLGRYFKADSAEDLAEAFIAAIRNHDSVQASHLRELAASELPERIRKFGKAYEQIVMTTIADTLHSGRS